MNYTPRPEQAAILAYQGGKIGVSAVPGSGKTHTLSALAATLIEKQHQEMDPLHRPEIEPEILIVTFSNAAVSNFATRISNFLTGKGLVPGIGYRVRTLHSMAADIVRERAETIGLDADFHILDESAANMLLMQSVDLWVANDGRETFNALVDPTFDEKRLNFYFENYWKGKVFSTASSVISKEKDYLITPEHIFSALEKQSNPEQFILLRMVAEIYQNYQTRLRAFPAVDFADLMYYAYLILKNDQEYTQILQQRWKIILEDEAQDSSLIQERVLRILTQKNENWVRVGDPNQAINETFTTADPQFLKDFLKEATSFPLSASGRSSISILRQANRLIDWGRKKHPTHQCRDALVEPYIQAVPPNDPQGNPSDDPSRIVYDPTPLSSGREKQIVSELAAEHARKFPMETIAILVTQNDSGTAFVDELKKYPVDVIEALKSTRTTRYTAESIIKILRWLSVPSNNSLAIEIFNMIYNQNAQDDFFLSLEHIPIAEQILKKFAKMEEFLYPLDNAQFQQRIFEGNPPEIVALTLIAFRRILKKWLESRYYRIDQLILLIAQDLFQSPENLGIANQLARIALQMLRVDPHLNLTSLAEKLHEAARNSNFPGLTNAETEFDPALYRGKIVITTYHKAKGLEWDQVFLTSCSNYEFPAGRGYIAQGYRETNRNAFFYSSQKLDLQAEALEQLKIVFATGDEDWKYEEGKGTAEAHDAYVSERLRLLYVGITRAKKGLYTTWNTGKRENISESILIQMLRQKQKAEEKS